ncbi:MAG TPA: cytochrome C biogenesis protein CcsB [Dehalococcoidia bacterium]|jgi:cytochrome c-type biogenesis protein|nr:cytochrome C biogenesis protein CcsB [Dehalococcoidia bacterium]
MENIPLIVALSGGLLSFLSPCVLPLVPVYLASLVGAEIFEGEATRPRLSLFFHSLSFVLGFSLVFVAMGTVAGLAGYVINPSIALLNKISGSLLIAFGLFMLAALKVPWLNYERRLAPSLRGKSGHLRSFLLGAAFSLAWTACVGPILGGILALALNSATAWHGAYLLALYSLGLGLPLLAVGVAFDWLAPLLKRLQRYARPIQVTSGLLLIGVGGLVLANRIIWFASLAG